MGSLGARDAALGMLEVIDLSTDPSVPSDFLIGEAGWGTFQRTASTFGRPTSACTLPTLDCLEAVPP